MAGPLYRYDAETVHPHGLPERFDGQLIFYDWMRNWMMRVPVDEEGLPGDIEPFLSDVDVIRPMDIELGPDGRLYILEWGQQYNGYNLDARLVRIDLLGGDTAPHDPQITPHTGGSAGLESEAVTVGAVRSKASAETGPKSVSISWPPNGFIFDYDQPITYTVDDEGAGRDPIAKDDMYVAMTFWCDSHIHSLDTLAGRSNTIRIPKGPTHSGYTIKRDEAILLEAYTESPASNVVAIRDASSSAASRSGGLVSEGSMSEVAVRRAAIHQAIDRVTLQPRRKEAEHFAVRQHADRRPIDVVRDALSVRTVMDVFDGGYLAYAPINLMNVSALNLRVQAEESGRVDVRLDGPQGRLLGSADVDGVAEMERRQTARGTPETPPGVDSHQMGEWIDLDVQIDDPGGTHALYLVFHGTDDEEDSGAEGQPSTNDAVLVLDWIEFVAESDPAGVRMPR